MDVRINTDKIKVLQDFFNDLATVDQKKIFMASYRKAAKPLIDTAKMFVPKKSGRLMKSIGSVEYPENVSVLIGARLGGLNKGWYGHIIEDGTVDRYQRNIIGNRINRRGRRVNIYSQGKPTGRVVGTHFFEKAFNQTEEKVYDSMAEEWYNEIDKLIVRTNKRLK